MKYIYTSCQLHQMKINIVFASIFIIFYYLDNRMASKVGIASRRPYNDIYDLCM